MSTSIAHGTQRLLHFSVQDVSLCSPIEYIIKILPLVELKHIPKSPDYCAGMMNFSGHSIPVIDLAFRLNLKRNKKYRLSTPIILCHDYDKKVGIIVDKIIGLTLVDEKNIQVQNQFTDKESYFKGSVNIDSKLSLLMNMEKIIAIHLTGFNYE